MLATAAAALVLTVGSSQRAVEPGETLPVHRGHAIAFYFSAPVSAVRVSGIKVEGEARHWSGTVPRRISSGTRRLRITAGGRTFTVRLRVLRRLTGMARVPKLVGRRSVAATIVLERRGLCWRFGRLGERNCDSGPPPPPWFRTPADERITEQSVPARRRVLRASIIGLQTYCTSRPNGETCD